MMLIDELEKLGPVEIAYGNDGAPCYQMERNGYIMLVETFDHAETHGDRETLHVTFLGPEAEWTEEYDLFGYHYDLIDAVRDWLY